MEDIADIVGGGTPKSTDQRFFGGNIPWLTPSDLSGYTKKYISHGSRFITDDGLNSSSAKIIPAGSVVFTSRAPIGYVAIAKNEVATNQGFKSFILKSPNLSPDYVYWWLKGAKALAESMASGTTFLELSGAKAKKLPIPIAPYEQQKRIIAKIEELFSHIEAGINALNKSKKLLKQYRQSVLKAAVTGELTKQWREENQDKLEPASELLEQILIERREKWEAQQLEQFEAKGKVPKGNKWKTKYKEPALPETEALPEIPNSWRWVELQHVFSVITDGDHQAPPKADIGIPFLVIGDVNKGIVTFGDKRFVPRSYYEELAEIRRPRKGDLLYTVVGSFGIPVKVETDQEFCVQRHIAILKPSEMMSVNFLYHILSSGFIYKQASDVSTGTAQKTVPLGGLRELKLPLPSYKEQLALQAILENKLDAISKLETESTNKILMAEKTKQSILASAFSGKLVSNRQSDGSAIEILEKINNEQTHTKSTKPKKQRKAKEKMSNRDLLSILESKSSGITPNALMQEAGFSIEEVDIFYQELEKISGKINELKIDSGKVKNWPYAETIILKLKD